MTLVELLIVIGIIALLIGVGASILRGPRSEISVKAGVDLCAALTQQASTAARTHRTASRLVINVDPDSPGYARQIAVYIRDGSGQWVRRSGPHLLPNQVYLDESTSSGFVTASYAFRDAQPQNGSTGEEVVAFEFDRNGHFIPPSGVAEPRLIVTAGTVPETGERSLTVGPNHQHSRSGFLFRRNGYITRFEEPGQIPSSDTTP